MALTLLDNWRSFYVDGAPALSEELRELTYGVPAPLEEADYLFFPRMGATGPRLYREGQKPRATFAGNLTKAQRSSC